MSDDSILNPVPGSQDEPNSVPGQELKTVTAQVLKCVSDTEPDPNADLNLETSDADSTSEPTVERIINPDAEPDANPIAEDIAEPDADLQLEENLRYEDGYSAEHSENSEVETDDDDTGELTCDRIFYVIFLSMWMLTVTLTVFVLGCFPCVYYFHDFSGINYTPLNLIPNANFDVANDYSPYIHHSAFIAKRVAVVQTDTEQCDTQDECAELLMNIERNFPMLRYNFAVSKSGDVYEGLGWNELSPMYEEKPTMVVAFIGDYKKTEPTPIQLEQFKILLSESVQMKYLSRSYTMVGRKLKYVPTKLLKSLSKWDKWNWEDSDSDEVSIDFEPYLKRDE